MCAIVVIGIVLFAGLFWAWVNFDWLDSLANTYEATTNTINAPFQWFVDLFVVSIP